MVLLILVVIVPTVGVLWFMLAAIDNERIAVRQRLFTAYRTQLTGGKTQLAAWLQQEAARLDSRVANGSCASVFGAVVLAGEADSLVCTAEDERASYPGRPTAPTTVDAVETGAWRSAPPWR